MAKQSSNRVKLNKEYKNIGRIPMSAIHKIEEFMELPLENSNHIAAVHLHYDKNEEFWLVTTVHAIKLKDLEKIPLIWEKK